MQLRQFTPVHGAAPGPGNTNYPGAQAIETSLALKTRTYLDQINRVDCHLNAMISVDAEGAVAAARALDRSARKLRLCAPTAGMIVSIKDNIDTAKLRTTCGSGIFHDRIPESDAEVVRRLRTAGMIVIGKTNLHEFAYGATNQNPHFGVCRNPWNPAMICGGSSGGAGVSVAARFCDVAIGTDTGGSIRVPAALTGVVGLRPSVGRVSGYGTMPVSPPFDTVGVMGRTAGSVAAAYEAIAGFDRRDPFSVDRAVEGRITDPAKAIVGLRIGIPSAYFFEGIEREVERAVHKAAGIFVALGATRHRVGLPDVAAMHDSAIEIVAADAAQIHLERIRREPHKYGKDVLQRLLQGKKVTGIEYAAALRARDRFIRDVRDCFDDVDVILTPTVGCAAPPVKSHRHMIQRTRELTRLTFVWSAAGVPALSVPCGFTKSGLPIGMQLIGPHWSEQTLLAACAAYQGSTDHHLRQPAAALK